MLSTSAGGNHANKIIINIWVHILNTSELNKDHFGVQRVFFKTKRW